MKHSAALASELLKEHHDRVPEGPIVRYPPKTPNAADFWIHTGVCPGCHLRSVSCGRCAECGWSRPKESAPCS